MREYDGMGREPPMQIPDRELWRRSRMIEVIEDDAARFLDLAGFADGRLDPDERERVAEWLAHDRAANDDVAVARALGETAHGAPSAAIIAAAAALVARPEHASGEVVAFAPRRGAGARQPARIQWAAQWGSLAAAVVLAGWLGFTLGADTFGLLTQGAPAGDDGFLNELLDPSAGLMRDFTDGPRA